MIKMFIILLLPVFSGRFLIELMLPEIRCNLFLKWGLSAALGLGVISFWMFFLGASGLPMNEFTTVVSPVALALTCGLLFIRRGDRNTPVKFRMNQCFDGGRLFFFDFFLIVIIAGYIIFTLNTVCFIPIQQWDAVATIAYKAKFFFYERTFIFNKSLPHSAYPLHVPLLMSWTAFVLGEWHEFLTKSVFFAYFISLLLITYGFLREFSDRRSSLLGCVFVCFCNYLILHSIIAYRDFPLAVYNSAVVLLIILWTSQRNRNLLFLAGLFSGIAAFTKLEGMGYALIQTIFLIIVLFLFQVKEGDFLKNFPALIKTFITFFLPAVILVAWYQIFKVVNGVPMGEENKTQIIFHFQLIARMLVILKSFLKNMFWTTYWGLNWYCLVLCLFFVGRKIFRLEHGLLLLSMLLFFLADIALFLFTPNYQYLLIPHYDVLLPRLILHFFPLCPIASALLLSRIIPLYESEDRAIET